MVKMEVGPAAKWPQHLLRVLLSLRAAPKKDSGKSSAELVYKAQRALLAKLTFDTELTVTYLRCHQNPSNTRHAAVPPPMQPPIPLKTSNCPHWFHHMTAPTAS